MLGQVAHTCFFTHQLGPFKESNKQTDYLITETVHSYVLIL